MFSKPDQKDGDSVETRQTLLVFLSKASKMDHRREDGEARRTGAWKRPDDWAPSLSLIVFSSLLGGNVGELNILVVTRQQGKDESTEVCAAVIVIDRPWRGASHSHQHAEILIQVDQSKTSGTGMFRKTRLASLVFTRKLDGNIDPRAPSPPLWNDARQLFTAEFQNIQMNSWVCFN